MIEVQSDDKREKGDIIYPISEIYECRQKINFILN